MYLKLSVFKIFLLLFVTVRSFSIDRNCAEDTEGYYWRDYTGKIPPDAFPGGKNSLGETTYIGQVLHKELLIPAKIDGDVYYEWGFKEFTPNILCTRFPELFEWMSSANGSIQYLENRNLIVGGFETGAKIYIGRRQMGSELVIGKVISTTKQTTLNTTKNGRGLQYSTFDVLAYNPNLRKDPWRNIIADIDVRSGAGSSANDTKLMKQVNININK